MPIPIPMLSLNQDPSQQPSLGARLGARLADIIWHRDYDAAKLAGSVIWWLWSLSLLNPMASAFDSATSYRAMAALAPEGVWGTLGLLLATNEFFSMLSRNRAWRVGASGALFAWALFVACMIGLVNPSGTGIAIYPGIGLVSCFAFWRSFRPSSEA